MEYFYAYLLITIILLMFTDLGSVFYKIVTFPARLLMHIVLFIGAIIAVPYIFYQVYKAQKNQQDIPTSFFEK
jgi:hypothetical protein